MTEITTPSGLRIEYTERPRGYTLNGTPVPSVTNVLRILDKPAIAWWSMCVGIEGFIELVDRYDWREGGLPEQLTTPSVIEMFKREGLHVNAVRNKAGTRGQAAHTALERLVVEGKVPDPREFPPADRGFVRALTEWHKTYEPEVVLSEVMVGSEEHGYAGRFDLLARIDTDLYLLDLKTTGKAPPRIYDEALLQLAAYALACEESGYPTPDKKVVVCVAPDGSYAVKESLCQPEHFLSILAAWWAVNDVKTLHTEAKAA